MLDINTPKGRETHKDTDRAITIYERHNPDHFIAVTHRDKHACADGFIIKKEGNELVSLVEIKGRHFGFETLWGPYNGELMMGAGKFDNCRWVADKMCMPFISLAFLVPEDVLLEQKLWEKEKARSYIRIAYQETKRSVNGGRKNQLTAFYTVSKEKRYCWDRRIM